MYNVWTETDAIEKWAKTMSSLFSLSLSKTEIDDTKNKLKCNLVSMNFVGSWVSGCTRDREWDECIPGQEQTNALIFN